MKRYTLHIVFVFIALMAVNGLWGQVNINGTWAGGTINGSFKLVSNTILNDCITISENLTLDLNGYTLERNSNGKHRFVFIVGENAKLVIKDTSTSKMGIIKGGRGDRGGCAYILGTVDFEGGTITDCIATDGDYGTIPTSDNQEFLTQGCGGAFYVFNDAVLNMSGNAKISKCSTEKTGLTKVKNDKGQEVSVDFGRGGAVFVAGTFKMEGNAIIESCKATLGGAVFIHGGYKNKYSETDKRFGQFQMLGGTIQQCGSYTHGSGVYSNGKVIISGNAVIQKNKPISWSELEFIDNKYPKVLSGGGHGSAIYADGENAVVEMTGGTLSNNLSQSGGAVMLWDKSTMTMTGGTMCNNYAIGIPGLGNGGAVYVQDSEFNFEGGSLSDNIANRYGGAININAGASLNLNGNCIISGNKASHGGGISQEAGECTLTLSNAGIDINKNEAHGHQVNFKENAYSVTNEKGNGGGLFIEKGTVTISAGKISNNTASGHGGGASLYVKRIHGRKTTVNIFGGEISGNTAEFGGGIDLYADFQSLVDSSDVKDVYTGKSELVVNFENGTLKENKATQNGAGIYVSFNEKFSTAQMTIGTPSSTPIVENNIAQNNGGGFGMSNNGEIIVKNVSASGNQAMNGGAVWLGSGNFTMHKGTFSNNEVSKNGGGIYLGGGTFTVPSEYNAIFKNNEAGKEGGGLYCAATFTINGTIAIQGNKAKNGAGVSVNGGSVTLSDGIIENNIAEQYGGGLYVIGEEVASFQGGTFTKNKAQAGGGICAIGKINLTLASNVNENTAVNGGGIYMADGVDMSFGQGIIKANKAESSTTIDTAENGTNETVYGVGGGIFMADDTSLKFTETSSLGIYGNAASNAAADIFANGNNTKIFLPNTKGMDLTGFDVPGNELYWVEDYVTGRYEDALKDSSLPIIKINFDDNEASKTISDYICLDLGYDLVFVTLKAVGLLNEDQAKIDLFYRVKDNSTDVARYTGVLFTGIADNGEVVREIGLPSGDWQFKPSDWFSERYGNVMGVSPSPYIGDFIKVTREGLNEGQAGEMEDKTITFTFDPKEDNIKYDNIIESHHRVVNYMGTGIK